MTFSYLLRYSLFTWFLLANFQLQAADPGNGTIGGTVRSADGQPAPFVSVALKDTGTGTTTDERGRYRLTGLAAGSYTLVVQGIGYAPQEQAVEVAEGAPTTADVTLPQSTRELGEVQVLGQKRRTASATRTNQELLDIPMSIQVIGQDVVQQQNAFDLATLTRNISGVNLKGTYAGGDTYQFFNARGFDLNNWQNYRRNGLMVWNMGTHFNDNIEAVEFLKGPAAILFGDVAPGGVMNFVTKKPLNYDYRRLELKVGQYGLLRPTLDVSGPLNEKRTLLYRVNTTYQQSNSFRDEVSSNALMLAPSLTWNVTPRLSWTGRVRVQENPGLGRPRPGVARRHVCGPCGGCRAAATWARPGCSTISPTKPSTPRSPTSSAATGRCATRAATATPPAPPTAWNWAARRAGQPAPLRVQLQPMVRYPRRVAGCDRHRCKRAP
jgi:iron complex outermembrane receptor protein